MGAAAGVETDWRRPLITPAGAQERQDAEAAENPEESGAWAMTLMSSASDDLAAHG